jgi:hypothetical protein
MSSRSTQQQRVNGDGNARPMYMWLVMHEKLPTYSMYFRDDVYSEPIETVNATCVGLYTTERAAKEAASHYFHEVLELDSSDDVDDETVDGEYNWEACDNGGDSGTWDERIHVECHEVNS